MLVSFRSASILGGREGTDQNHEDHTPEPHFSEFHSITKELLLTDLLNDVKSWASSRGYLQKLHETLQDGTQTFTWIASDRARHDLSECWLWLYDELDGYLRRNVDHSLELGYLRSARFKARDGHVFTYRVTGKAIVDLGHLFNKPNAVCGTCPVTNIDTKANSTC
ncbi:hypothetical protein ACXWTF_12790 [Thiomicrolovo sp. ZZH C-3]